MIPFISSIDLGAYMDTTVSPTDLKTEIALDSACEAVRSYLGQDINLVEDDLEIHSGTGKWRIRLRQRPVREVSGLFQDDEEIDPDSYSINGAFISLLDGFFFEGLDNIEVIYTHGYDVADVGPDTIPVPADIRLVALNSARRIYENIGAEQTENIRSETIGSYQYQLQDANTVTASELLDSEKVILDRYKVALVV